MSSKKKKKFSFFKTISFFILIILLVKVAKKFIAEHCEKYKQVEEMENIEDTEAELGDN